MMIKIDLIKVFIRKVNHENLILPKQYTHILEGDQPEILVTKDDYENGLPWDGNASPKPTWQDLLDTQEEIDVEEELEDSPFRFNDDDQAQFAKHGAKARVAFCECAIDDIHIGSGITNMTGLIHHVDSANLAGENLPPVHMRSKKGKLKTYLTQKEMRKVLADIAERENIVESAHNALLVKFEETRAVYDNESEIPTKRLEARDLLRKMVRVSTDPATEIDTDNPKFYQDFLTD